MIKILLATIFGLLLVMQCVSIYFGDWVLAIVNAIAVGSLFYIIQQD